MKREDVKKQMPGITDEQLDWLMAEHGKALSAEKDKTANLAAQLETASGQLKAARDGLAAFDGVNVDELRGQIAGLQSEMRRQAEGFAFDAELDGAIRDAKGRSVKAIRAMLDVEALKASKNRTADILSALESCRAENPWGFGGEGTPMTVDTGGEHGSGVDPEETDGVMTAFYAMNPELKN